MIELRNLSKSFVTADGPVEALKHVNLTINNGDIYGIIGMSGAGKSTLVRCINMLERPTEGSVVLDGCDLGMMSKTELRQMRQRVTMIFQGFNLLMQRTCVRNVMLPLKLSGKIRKQILASEMELAEEQCQERGRMLQEKLAAADVKRTQQGEVRVENRRLADEKYQQAQHNVKEKTLHTATVAARKTMDVTRAAAAPVRKGVREVRGLIPSLRKWLKVHVELPIRYHKQIVAAERARALELLEIVNLPDKANSYPAQLSGGQQQRVAIARALATDPDVLLCDEATSALDPKTTHAILELIREINQKLGITVIVITHQMSVVQEICNRVAILENGAVVEEGEVADVFANPRAEATKNLVYPEMADANVALGDAHGQRVRIIFNGAIAANEPLIARMAMEIGIAASILGASTRAVGDRAYGYILLEIPGGPDELARAVNFLRQTPDVTVQVQVDYAQEEVQA